jgi:hypothetical protein
VTAHETAGSSPGATVTFGAAERRPPAGMPLHAITACYGEGGLRERSLAEAGRLPVTGRDRVSAAIRRHRRHPPPRPHRRRMSRDTAREEQ